MSKEGGLIPLISEMTAIQCIVVADEFCDKFSISSIGEKFLKFSIPADLMVHCIHSLIYSKGIANYKDRDFIVISACHRIRAERGLTSRVQIPSALPSQRLTSDVASDESFPLHYKSKLKYSGPEWIIAISLSECEAALGRWLVRNPSADGEKFFSIYPFDAVVRALKAAPHSVANAEWLIQQVLATRGRYRYTTVSGLRERIDERVSNGECSELLKNKLSMSYSYLIVSDKISHRDDPVLAQGPSAVTVDSLQRYITGAPESGSESEVSQCSAAEDWREWKRDREWWHRGYDRDESMIKRIRKTEFRDKSERRERRQRGRENKKIVKSVAIQTGKDDSDREMDCGIVTPDAPPMPQYDWIDV